MKLMLQIHPQEDIYTSLCISCGLCCCYAVSEKQFKAISSTANRGFKKKKKSISKGKNDDYECIIFVSRKETNGTLWKPLRKYLNGIFFLIPRSCFETNHCFCP